jgi:MSHA biogenesis protein MshN
MDLFPMSLINKMLQDLEARRSEGEVVHGLQGQLRAAASEPRRIHPAVWIAIVLAMVMVAMVSWFWGRQTAPASNLQAELPLKLASNLTAGQTQPKPITPSAAAQNPEKVAAPAAKPAVEILPQPSAPVPNPPVAVAAPAAVPVPTPAAPAPPVVAMATPAVAATPPAPKPQTATPPQPQAEAAQTPVVPVRTAASVRSRQAAAESPAGFDIPANVSKQMKDLTPQQRAENEYRRATGLMQQNSNAEAMRALETALQLDPQHMVARQTLVGLLLEGKRNDEAIRKLQDGLVIDKAQPALAMMLARLQVEKGELKPAIETLQRTLPSATDRADYQAFLAALYQRDARHKEAVEHYFAALRKAPQNGLWWMGLGISLQADNRLPDARDAFTRAKAANSLSPELQAFVDQKLTQLR